MLGGLDPHLAAEGVHHAAANPIALRQLDGHLTSHPDALTSGASTAPPSVVRLAHWLADHGVATVRLPVCADCGRARELPCTIDGGRVCRSCAATRNRDRCSRCDRVARVYRRDSTGPVCSRCYAADPATHAPCAGCGRTRRPVTRRPDGAALCQHCAPRPLHECIRCGQLRPANSNTPAGPVCRRCYRDPQRRCAGCGQVRRISQRATDDHGDLCASCYARPVPGCRECASRQRCEHDSVLLLAEGRSPIALTDAELRRLRARNAPRPHHDCVICRRSRPVKTIWPRGPVCASCYDNVLETPRACARCGTRRPLIGGTEQAPVCGPCAGDPRSYACTGCCQPCRPYIEGRCARCELDRRLTGILAGPDDEIPAQLRPLHHAFVTAEHPKARLKWLSDSHGATVLATLVDSGQPLAHELLDQLPQTRELHYLRGLMVATGVLPDREEHLDRLPAWLEQRLEHAPPNHARLVRTYATWSVLRRFRHRARTGRFTDNSARSARQRILVVLDFLSWLDDHHRKLPDLTQADVDLWMASGSTRRREIRYFLRWTTQRGLTAKALTATIPQARSSVIPANDD
ncbi:MAG: hypothetical protein E6F99_30760, partial [Actinobacteria bacterium]